MKRVIKSYSEPSKKSTTRLTVNDIKPNVSYDFNTYMQALHNTLEDMEAEIAQGGSNNASN